MSLHFVRVVAAAGEPIPFLIDGEPAEALPGDTILAAVLAAGKALRLSDTGDGHRAGFCLMGACQDCMVELADGRRLRACATPVEPGMDVLTARPGAIAPGAVPLAGENT